MFCAVDSVSMPITVAVYWVPSMPRRNVYSTSSTVIGFPSANVALGLSVKVAFLRSSEISILVAIIGAVVSPSATRMPSSDSALRSMSWS